MATAPFGIWGQVAARLQHWANGVKEPWFQGGGDCTYPSVASNPLGAGWPVPAAPPSVLPASGAHPGPAQVCSDSGSCCGAWCLCGPAPCLAPAPGPAPDLDPPGPAPAPSPAPGPALGCALAASLAPAAGSVPARPPSPSPSALLLLAPFAASPAPWPVQPALPPSEQSVAGRKAENRHLNLFTPVPPGPGPCTPSSGSPSALLLHRKGEGPAVTPVLVSEPQAFPLFTCYRHDR